MTAPRRVQGSPRRHRRGVTLLESLLAAVLLATLVVAAAPLLRPVSSGAPAASRAGQRVALGVFADRVATDPVGAGLTSPATEGVILEWPQDLLSAEAFAGLDLDPVAVHVIRSDDPEVAHAWIRCVMGELSTLRWIPVTPASSMNEGEAPDGA